MERDKVVINGCSGGCCTRFTLPVSMADLLKLKAEILRTKEVQKNSTTDEEYQKNYELMRTQRVECENGAMRLPPNEKELDKLIEMLIYIEDADINPQTGKSFDEELLKDISAQQSTYEYLQKHNLKNWNGSYNVSKKMHITSHTYTCKHFDVINKICTNYENRPDMCKSFGRNCSYSGCTYKKQYEEKLKEDGLFNPEDKDIVGVETVKS